MLLKQETNWRWFPLSSSPFCSIEKKKKEKPLRTTGRLPLAHLSVFRTTVPQVLLFLLKGGHFEAGMPLIEHTMGSVLTPFHFALHAKTSNPALPKQTKERRKHSQTQLKRCL